MKSATRNIVLVGFMGTGKTTVGKPLAQRLDMTFLDMDDEIVRREQMPVSRIFAEKGEPHFRALERALAVELAGRTGLVIGTGGGIVLNPDNIRDFSRTGLVVCLSLEPATIVERLAGDASRPLLAGDDKLRKIRDILDKRRPLYDAIPHQIDRNTLDVAQTVNQIIALVERMPG
jgi:shikimate kinase